MAASMTMVVLCNGTRQTVKVTPNTSVLQLLEEACKKQGINPEDYDINHYNKPLDLSLSIRYANLPNNALLELGPRKQFRREGSVTVRLQLETGDQLTDEFSPASSLWDIFCHWENAKGENFLRGSEATGEPIFIYMRREILGDSIKQTTLRSLGLTGGKAAIRLLYRQPSVLREQAHVSTPLAKPLAIDSDQQMEISDVKSVERSLSDCSGRKLARLDLQCSMESVQVPQQNKSKNLSDLHSHDIKTAENKGNDNSHTNSKEKENDKQNDSKLHSVKQCDEFAISRNEDSKYNATLDNTNKEQNFDVGCLNKDWGKGRRLNDPEVMDLDSAVENNDEQMQKNEHEEKIIYLGERNAVLFNLEDISQTNMDLPDDFFELTIEDARFLLADLRKQRMEMEDKPLELNFQRVDKEQQLKTINQQIIIRVHFPSRFVLQGIFESQETVHSIMEFTRKYLEDENLIFYLYITPPKVILAPETTLLEYGLVPSAVVHFGCEQNQSYYLKESIRKQVSDPGAAMRAVSRGKTFSDSQQISSQESTSQLQNEMELAANQVSGIISDSQEREQIQRAEPTDKKVPKWLKFGNK